jgi:hypothetical protein
MLYVNGSEISREALLLKDVRTRLGQSTHACPKMYQYLVNYHEARIEARIEALGSVLPLWRLVADAAIIVH